MVYEDRADNVELSSGFVRIFVRQNGALVPDRDVLNAKELLTINQVAVLLGISVSKVYELCGDDKPLKTIKVGRCARIRADSVRRLLEG
jgi:excisionase family DNA binding protein